MTPFERWAVWGSSILVTLTGLVFAWMKYLLTPADPFAVVHHPLQPLVLKLHIVTAPLLVFAVGMIALRHVWRHFRTGMPWGRRTGLTVALLFVPMVLTGYLIQAVTHQGWLAAMAWSHLGLGVVYALGLVAHQRVINRGLPPKLCDTVGRVEHLSGRRTIARIHGRRVHGPAGRRPRPSEPEPEREAEPSGTRPSA